MTIYRSPAPVMDIGKPAGLFTFTFSNPRNADPDSPAIIDAITGDQYSRKELQDICLRFAHGTFYHGMKRGDVAMIFSPNSLGFAVALFGLMGAGIKATLANSSYQPHELAHQLTNSRAGYVFVHPALFPVLIKAFASYGITEKVARQRTVILSYTNMEKGMEAQFNIDKGWMRLDDFLNKGKKASEERFDGEQAKETAFLCYSSGTTGLSKGVETSHWNVQADTVLTISLFKQLTHKDRCLAVLPWFHIYGISCVLVQQLHFGVPLIVMPRFDPELFCSSIEKYKITLSHIVPPILVVLLAHPGVEKYDMKSLEILTSGAAPLGLELVQRVKKRFAQVGNNHIYVTQGYGLTETSPATHYLPLEISEKKAGSIGYLIPNLEARLVDDDEKDVPVGDDNRGELWLRGPIIMNGYLHNRKATQNSITPDGWFKTGDVATVNSEGLWHIVDRKKELIKYKGFQVPPADLEGFLLSHQEIADVAVIGVYDKEQATELPRAYVVSTNNDVLLKDAEKCAEFQKKIQAWVKSKVANHKQLRGGVVVIPVIPKSATGKILRKDLRAMVAKEMEALEAKKAVQAKL
ncbi:AMP binding protein [Clavulina sp. PMI_390]|nr:AMP binding protein [Clavulina sp. PMI_390]